MSQTPVSTGKVTKDGSGKKFQGKALNSQSRGIVLSVYQYFEKEKELQHFERPCSQAIGRTAEATGVGERTVSRIKGEAQKNGLLRTPGKERPNRPKELSKVDDFSLELIRRKVHDFFRKGDIPTVSSLLSVLQNEVKDFPYGRTSLWKLLIKVGFRYNEFCYLSNDGYA